MTAYNEPYVLTALNDSMLSAAQFLHDMRAEKNFEVADKFRAALTASEVFGVYYDSEGTVVVRVIGTSLYVRAGKRST